MRFVCSLLMMLAVAAVPTGPCPADGGGLTGGSRSFPAELNRSDLVVATVEYRLHPDVTLHELDGFDHGGMATPAFPLLLKFVDRVATKSP
jgi:hypothetical protein